MKLQKLIPSFSVDNVVDTVEFYQDILEFSLEMCVSVDLDGIDTEISEDDEYVYAMVSRDEVSLIFLREDHFQLEIPALRNCPRGASVLFYIEVIDIEKVYNCLEEKVEIVKQLETTWYGMREFFIKDNNGYILGFSEQV
ncbi:MAG: VOC family protein [Epsilonproteobacteria bacterium]|nr:VOC family protein [Campylobacterota bacterium]